MLGELHQVHRCGPLQCCKRSPMWLHTEEESISSDFSHIDYKLAGVTRGCFNPVGILKKSINLLWGRKHLSIPTKERGRGWFKYYLSQSYNGLGTIERLKTKKNPNIFLWILKTLFFALNTHWRLLKVWRRFVWPSLREMATERSLS